MDDIIDDDHEPIICRPHNCHIMEIAQMAISAARENPLAKARERGETHPYRDLHPKVMAIIRRDGNPTDDNASLSGGANEIIELCRLHFCGPDDKVDGGTTYSHLPPPGEDK